jgi:hypothetical protein
MLSLEGKRIRQTAVDSLTQFIESAIHAFLLARSVYPRSSFGCHMRFGIAVWLCDVKSVKSYVRRICMSLQNILLHDRVHAIVIETPQEKFTIELPEDFPKSVFYALPTGSPRTELEIKSLCASALREALIYLDRKLGKVTDHRMNDETASQQTWEVYVDLKNSSAQATETMDMPSGWIIEERAANFDSGSMTVQRKPIKSTMMGENVVISTYTDILG